jgi:hypothetical protein
MIFYAFLGWVLWLHCVKCSTWNISISSLDPAARRICRQATDLAQSESARGRAYRLFHVKQFDDILRSCPPHAGSRSKIWQMAPSSSAGRALNVSRGTIRRMPAHFLEQCNSWSTRLRKRTGSALTVKEEEHTDGSARACEPHRLTAVRCGNCAVQLGAGGAI